MGFFPPHAMEAAHTLFHAESRAVKVSNNRISSHRTPEPSCSSAWRMLLGGKRRTLLFPLLPNFFLLFCVCIKCDTPHPPNHTTLLLALCFPHCFTLSFHTTKTMHMFTLKSTGACTCRLSRRGQWLAVRCFFHCHHHWTRVAYGKGLFMAVAFCRAVMSSPDAIIWTLGYSVSNNSWTGIAYGNDLFVVVAFTGSGDRAMCTAPSPPDIHTHSPDTPTSTPIHIDTVIRLVNHISLFFNSKQKQQQWKTIFRIGYAIGLSLRKVLSGLPSMHTL